MSTKNRAAVSTLEQSTLDFNINGIDADNFTTSVLWTLSSYVRFHTPM